MFEANRKHEANSEHVVNSERCMIDGSWTHDELFSGYGWTWITSRGITQLLGARNQRRRISPLHSELDALSWAMECMLQLSTCHAFGTDYKDLVSMIQDPGAWPNFSTELKELMKLKSRFTDFSIFFIPRSENVSSDLLAKIAKSFYRDMYYMFHMFYCLDFFFFGKNRYHFRNEPSKFYKL